MINFLCDCFIVTFLPSPQQYPMSLARQQIELEMKQLRDIMQKSLGCPEEVATRQRKRAIRLHSIDQKLKELYSRKEEHVTEVCC